MDHARLGRTELSVSVASLGSGGASRLGQQYGASFDDSVRVVRTAMDSGVNAVDTASGYRTEEIIGAAVSGHRGDVVISTKSGITENPFARASNLISGAAFAERIRGSLTRLGTDYIDILEVHGLELDHYDYCIEEIVPILERFKEEGSIRFSGVSEAFGSDPGHEMLRRAVEDDYFDVMMVGLNVVNHSALARVIPLAKQKDVGIQCMYAVRRKLAHHDLARSVVEKAVAAGEVDPAAIDVGDPLGFLVGPGAAKSLVEACYRFDRHAPGVDTVLTGTGSVDHLVDNLRSINQPALPERALAQIGRLFGRVRSVTGD
jgi:aryl-alcohol dehydrogenase-like predicted oxidoreductase